tara:strand:+ start:717 stop:920 length:204 start_codon:yes stop_codon:yes gene_type:complete
MIELIESKTYVDDSALSNQDREDILREVLKDTERMIDRLKKDKVQDVYMINQLSECVAGIDIVIDSF